MMTLLPILLMLQLSASPASGARPTAMPNAASGAPDMSRWLSAMGFPPGADTKADQSSPIGQVTLAPLFHIPFLCDQHPQGSLRDLGDALGSDCMVMGGALDAGRGHLALYRTDGRTNADWYGWRAEVHAPFDGVVIGVSDNPVTNAPGTMGKPPAGSIAFERADGTRVVFAHVMDARVRKGDRVRAGQVVALDGNNGMARNPHVHVGAWRGQKALEIRWDLAAMEKVPALADN